MYRKKIIKVRVLICLALFIHSADSVLKSQNRKQDSLKKVVLETRSDTVKLTVLCKLGKYYGQRGYYDTAMRYTLEANLLGEKIKLASGTINKYKLFLKRNLPVIYSMLGIIHTNQGNYKEAIKAQLKCLKLAEEAEMKSRVAYTYINIGNIYSKLNDSETALKYDSLGLKMLVAMNDKGAIATLVNSIGSILRSRKNYQKALECHKYALKLFEELQSKTEIAGSMGYIGIIFQETGDFTNALINQKAALKIFEEENDERGIYSTNANISVIYLKQKKFNEAYSKLSKALWLAKKMNDRETIKEIYFIIATADSSKHNYKDAIESHKKFILYRDSSMYDANIRKVKQEQMLFDFNKNKIIVDAQHKREIQLQKITAEAKDKKQKIITWIVSGCLLLIMSIAGFVFISLRTTRRQKKIIENKNNETESN